MFNDQLECLEAIANQLVGSIREPWVSVSVDAKLAGDSVDLCVVLKRPDQSEGNIPHVPMLARYFHQLARLVSDEDRGLFTACHYVLQNDGTFETKYDY